MQYANSNEDDFWHQQELEHQEWLEDKDNECTQEVESSKSAVTKQEAEQIRT